MYLYVKSSRVSFVALSGRYQSDLRVSWAKVLEGDEEDGEEGKEGGGSEPW